MPHLTRLQDLTLRFAPKLESLRLLSSGPITRTLTRLAILNCRNPQLRSTELHHVHALRSLTHLSLHRSFVKRLDTFARSLYAPPSLLLPKLVDFQYTSNTTNSNRRAKMNRWYR
jgi:hypothetical protein